MSAPPIADLIARLRSLDAEPHHQRFADERARLAVELGHHREKCRLRDCPCRRRPKERFEA